MCAKTENKYIGFDTSNYTTSVGVLTGAAYYICKKKPLPVPSGEKGLRQSDAVFLHVKALPELIQELDLLNPIAVGASVSPRNTEGSYMPCFLPGLLAAKAVAGAAGVPFYGFSHQQGHIASVLFAEGKEDFIHRPFFAYHLSGGTMELLFVNGFDNIKIVSKTLDITAGQLIDRVGVFLGLEFPCGAAMEQLAGGISFKSKIKIARKEADVCLSGYENAARKIFDETSDAFETARFVQSAVLENIKNTISYTMNKFGAYPVVFAGGVMSNQFLRESVKNICEAYFAPPPLSSDNAVGIAYLAKLKTEGKL